MKSEFENGVDAGLEISLTMLNRELDSDFTSLGSALNFLWKVSFKHLSCTMQNA